jgi:hypothetical protein
MPKNNKKAPRKSSKKKTANVDLSKDPYFVKKTEEAKKLIDRVGMPKF